MFSFKLTTTLAVVSAAFCSLLFIQAAEAKLPYYVQFRDAHCSVKKGSKWCGTKGSTAVTLSFSFLWNRSDDHDTAPRPRVVTICLLNSCKTKGVRRYSSDSPIPSLHVRATFYDMGPYRCGSLAKATLIADGHRFHLNPKINCWR